MRLRLEHESAAPHWLIGDPTVLEREWSDVLTDTWQITRQNQGVAGAGYKSKVFYDRGNQGVAFDMRGHWIFEDEFARMDFIASLAPVDDEEGLHEWEGDCFLRVEKGDVWQEWPAPGAVISLSSVAIDAEVGLHLTYRVQVPGLSRTTTAGMYDWLLDTSGQPLLDTSGRRLASAEHDA